MKESKNTINWDKSSILDQEENWFIRGVMVAIPIYTNSAFLNRNSGCHDLPLFITNCYRKRDNQPSIAPDDPPVKLKLVRRI